MSNHSDNASNTIASTVHTDARLITNPRLSVLSNSLYGVIAYISSTVFNSPFSTDKKNHRLLSMIFFLLSVLVIFRLTHG